jgi:hypothetical protein
VSVSDEISVLRTEMDEEERHRFDGQARAMERASEQQLLQLAQRRVVEQALPIGQPDAVPKTFTKKTHGLTDALLLPSSSLQSPSFGGAVEPGRREVLGLSSGPEHA